jgi:catechol 2,3-dioxygenase-like lactoylglutathione lyase family enzyme
MQLKYFSLIVADQADALKFYTDTLGFRKIADVPAGEYRWLTVTPPDGIEGVELSLEPAVFPHAREYQKACFDAGIPLLMLTTNDIRSDFDRLTDKGVAFRGEPIQAGTVTMVAFEDTCGNLVILVQPEA